jgi:O-antigen/teichoic acid export membrane protein
MSSTEHRFAFFKQTGWMGLATGLGGLFMSLVHMPAARMPPAEYGVLLMFLQVLNLMLIPAMGLQTVVAQQTAAAITREQQAELSHTVRVLFIAMLLLWACAAVATFIGRDWLLTTLKIGNPAALWVTLVIGLASLWYPILLGILQGQQNFLWLGWLQIINGFVRFAGVIVIVWWLGGYAAGALAAALFAYGVALTTAAWLGKNAWMGAGRPVEWRKWLRRVVPLTLGLAASQFMMAADQIVVQRFFDREVTARYGAAGMIGRALVFFTGALVAVMFPKIVRSVAKSEKTDVAAIALATTAIVGTLAGIVFTIVPALPLKILYYFQPEYWSSSQLVPWFVWCMLPLTLANVLINNLLARGRFACVPWLLLVAAGYGAALVLRADKFAHAEMFTAFKMVIQTIGAFSLLLLAVAAFFTWRRKLPVVQASIPDAGSPPAPPL